MSEEENLVKYEIIEEEPEKSDKKSKKAKKIEVEDKALAVKMPKLALFSTARAILDKLLIKYSCLEETTPRECENDIKNAIKELSATEIALKSKEIYGIELEVFDIIDKRNIEVSINNERTKPLKIEESKYSEMMASRLMKIFTSGKTMTYEEASNVYGDVDYLNSKYDDFVELIDFINQNEISIIPDRSMFASYLGMTMETYASMLEFNYNEETNSVFQKFEQYSISLRLNASETGSRSSQAIKTNLSYEKYGNNLRPNEAPQKITNNFNITNDKIYERLRKIGYQPNHQKVLENKDNNY